jgi:hypothetical protein
MNTYTNNFDPRTSVPTDGAGWGPGTNSANNETVRESIGKVSKVKSASWRGTLSRVRRVEGSRGVAIRYSVGLRYVGYFLVIIACSVIGNASFSGTAWQMAGTLMLFSAAAMTLTATLGAMFIPQKRTEIVEDFRHFLFQIALLPATGIAIFQWVLSSYSEDPRHQDNFLGLLSNSLPLLFAFTVFVPAIVFVKAVAGRRMLDRTQQDDQELMQAWTRQDKYMP